jgi:hypothetical protein
VGKDGCRKFLARHLIPACSERVISVDKLAAHRLVPSSQRSYDVEIDGSPDAGFLSNAIISIRWVASIWVLQVHHFMNKTKHEVDLLPFREWR